MSFKIVLENEIFTSFEEFARNIYLHPDAAEKLLTSTKFLSFLAEEDKDKFQKLIECNHKIREADAFLFHAQFIFCPHMELRYHGYKFDTLKELGEKILSFGPVVDIYLKDMLKFKLLSFYMENQGLKELDPLLYEKVEKLENEFHENENKSYFLLGFALSKCDTIIYEGEKFNNVKDFFSRMTKPYFISRFSSDLEKSQYVYAWLEVKGYGNIVSKYLALVNTIEQLEK